MSSRPSFPFVAPLLLLDLIASSFGMADQAPPPLVERIEVSVVNVDVLVVDAEGRPVRALTADNFTILEDGKPQQLAGFFRIEGGEVQIEGQPKVPASKQDWFRRKVVLMFDNNSLDAPSRDAAIEQVQRFMDLQFTGDYEWSVVSVGPEVQTIQPFTDWKGDIDSALLEIRRSPTYHAQREMDRRFLSDPVLEPLRESEFDSPDRAERADAYGRRGRFMSQEQTARHLLATMKAAEAVIQTSRAYSGHPGKKILLLVTGGIELNTSFAAFDDSTDRNMREMKREMEQLLDTMVKEANAANFGIYVINAQAHSLKAPQHDVANRSLGISGLSGDPRDEASYSLAADVSDTDSASLTLTMGTGGRYLPSSAIDRSLETVDEETGNYYSLAYRPAHQGDANYHRIEVRVNRPGLRVRHREGYVDLSLEQQIERSLRSPLTFAKEKGNLPVAIELGLPERSKTAERLLPITAVIPIDRLTLLPREGNHLGRVHVYLAVYDREGNKIGYVHRVQDLSIPESSLEEARTREFRYTIKTGLKPGTFTLVMTLRDDLSNEFGTAFQDVGL